jgi:hypothetical protein
MKQSYEYIDEFGGLRAKASAFKLRKTQFNSPKRGRGGIFVLNQFV